MSEFNPAYQDRSVLEELRAVFVSEGSVQLLKFFDSSIEGMTKKLVFKHKYVPHKYSFRTANFKKVVSLFEYLEPLVSVVTNEVYAYREVRLMMFKHRDYTLLHDNLKGFEGVHVLFDFNSISPEAGGWTSFLENGKEFVRVIPVANSLSIVRSNNQVVEFTKYVNHKCVVPRVVVWWRFFK